MVLTEVVRAGKARHIGFSEWPVQQVEPSLALPGTRQWSRASRNIRCFGGGPRRK